MLNRRMSSITHKKLPLLASYEGMALYAAPQAMLKGLLESEVAASIIAAPGGEPFGDLLRLGRTETTVELLTKHEMRLVAAPTASRAVTLALRAARSSRLRATP